jgi:hypothetical protein
VSARTGVGDEHNLLLSYGNKSLSRVLRRQLQLIPAGIENNELGGRARAISEPQNVVELYAFIPEGRGESSLASTGIRSLILVSFSAAPCPE